MVVVYVYVMSTQRLMKFNIFKDLKEGKNGWKDLTEEWVGEPGVTQVFGVLLGLWVCFIWFVKFNCNLVELIELNYIRSDLDWLNSLNQAETIDWSDLAS